MSVNKKVLSYLTIASMLGFAGSAHADITGTIAVKIELEKGCMINGSNAASGSGSANFGTLDFGIRTTLFDNATVQVSGGMGGITVQCTKDVPVRLVFKTGLHDANTTSPGNKAMRHSSYATQHVAYHLIAPDNSTVMNENHPIALNSDGTEQTITISGRAFGAQGLPAGVYSDTVTVVLEM